MSLKGENVILISCSLSFLQVCNYASPYEHILIKYEKSAYAKSWYSAEFIVIFCCIFLTKFKLFMIFWTVVSKLVFKVYNRYFC